MDNLSFTNFLKNEEAGLLDALSQQLNINLDDLKKDPKLASFYSFGANTYNLGSYVILDYKKNREGKITHVLVKQINDPKMKNVQYRNNNIVKNSHSNKKFLVPIEDLEKLMLQGQDKPADAGMGMMGAMGGMV